MYLEPFFALAALMSVPKVLSRSARARPSIYHKQQTNEKKKKWTHKKSYSLVNDYLSQAFNVFAENSILVSKYTKEHLMEYFIKVIKKAA